MSRSYVSVFLLIIAVAGLMGCRNYGEYNSEEKMYEEMKQVVQQSAEELKRAEEDLHLLEKAASDTASLQSVAQRFHDLVEEHRLLLADQRERLDALSSDAGYRSLSRAYRAMVKEQQLFRQHYRRLIRAVRSTVQGVEEPPAPNRVQDRSRYYIEPLGFPRSRQGESMTMEQALQLQ